MNEPTPPALPLASRSTIVLIALLQGLMLYAVQELAESWPFHDVGHRFRWYAWVLTVPTAVALTLVDLRDRTLWLHAAVGSAVVLALASWVGWNAGGPAKGMEVGGLVGPFSICMAVATFVILPYWQYRLQHGQWRAPYAALFERAWQNGLTLVLAGAFTGLTWIVLWMGAALFKVVNIDFLTQLLMEPAFIGLATGALLGFGVLIGRTQHRAIQVIRLVLFAICRGLLPLLSLIAVAFVLLLPFTGLETLWKTPSATALLTTVSLWLVVFVNAVYQHQEEKPAYPAWLRRLVEASLLVMPLYAALALYAMGLRIAQYGWTLERFWGVVVVVLLAGYAIGYAVAVLRRRGRWLQGIEWTNRVMCWTVFGTALLASSPILDGIRIGVASQIARLEADPGLINRKDVLTLRFQFGRRGVEALEALQRDPRVAADARATDIITEALARSSRWDDGSERKPVDERLRDVATLKRQLTVAKGSPTPDDAWWQGMVDQRFTADECLKAGQECVVMLRDLDGDGVDDLLLCALTEYIGPTCRVHVHENGQWRDEGDVSFLGQYPRGSSGDESNAALRAGQLEIHPKRWPLLAVPGGRPVNISSRPPKQDRP